MPPETLGATAQPLFDLPAVQQTHYSTLAETQVQRVMQLTARLAADRQMFTDWRELMCAVVAAEVATAVARMLPERD
jgi:hypothetical protein